MESVNTSTIDQNFEVKVQTVDQTTESSFGKINFFLKEIPLLCLQVTKLEQLDSKNFFIEALVISTKRRWDFGRSDCLW